MASEFRLPALGADMESGTIVQWNVAPGDKVRRGQVVAVVETEKGAIDVEIFEDGVVRELVVPVGTNVPVGTVIARLESDARAKISPAARVRARELGVDVSSLRGTGPDGAITIDDVDRARPAAAPTPQPGPAQVTTAAPQGPASQGAAPEGAAAGGMREAIASAMSRSKREIPHYYLSLTTDVTAAIEWLSQRNAALPVTERLLFAALLVKAVALACRDVRGFSGFFRDGRYEESPAVHVGIAVALRGGGLVAPAIMDTADKPLPVLMEEFRQVVMRARAGRLRASELAAPTIVLTSLGDSAVDAVFPIIQPPQVAIVGAGPVVVRPWVVDGRVEPRSVVTLSLGADHRVTDGRLGAQFLGRIAARVAVPAEL
jgi:pyruvate dehydrogenase E2 component (dihydrolipoyllysine-residue acetyltransferase)